MIPAEVVAAAALWVAAGAVCAAVLFRRGHDGWGWLALGVVTGPLAALWVADQARVVEAESDAAARGAGDPGGTVVVAPHRLDDVRAVAAAVDQLDRPGPVTIVAAVPYEAGDGARRGDAVAALDRTAALLAHRDPALVVLAGRLPDMVVRHAAGRGAEVVVAARAALGPSGAARLGRLVARRPGLSFALVDGGAPSKVA